MAVKFCFLVLVILVACCVGNINAGRFSASRTRVSSSWRSSRPSASRPSHTSSSGSSHGSSIPHGSHSGHVPYPSHSSPSHPSVSSFPSAPHQPSSPPRPGFETSVNRSPPNHGSMGGTSVSQQNKDVSTSLIKAEGGGASRPSHAPSAPLMPEVSNRVAVTNNMQQSSPHAPSAPMESISKVSTPLQTHGQPGAGTAWGNPHYNPGQPSVTGSHSPPPPGFKVNTGSQSPPPPGFNVNTNPQPSNTPYNSGVHYPMSRTHHTSHTHPQNRSHTTNTAYPTNTFPSAPSQPHYPINPYGSNPISAPYPTHPMGQPGHMSGVGQPHYPFSPSHGSYPGSPYGNPSYPAHSPIGNPYQTYHPGGMGGAYPQQPQVLAQPASQPFVPGQTVIMMPGQQDNGRGFGQLVKEALVFSTINAGVNRFINPHHHHYVTESRPANPDVNSGTTHITYNNQYFNTLPNGSTVQVSAPGVPDPAHPAGVYNPVYGTGSAAGNAGNPGYALSSGSVIPPSTVQNYQPGSTATNAGLNPSAANINTNVNANHNANANANAQNQGTPVNNNPATNTVQYKISDDALRKITEELFSKEEFNVSKGIILNLQNKSASINITDIAKERLIFVQPDVYEMPTIRAIRTLYDNYEWQAGVKENVTLDERKEQNLFLDVILNTNVMTAAMQWLSDNGFIDPDDFERKDILQHMWFNMYDGSTSGFERIFTSEIYGNTSVLGVQDWLYFNYLEMWHQVNYLGYVDKLDLGDKASLLKLNFEMNGIVRPNATIFVGTMPELEMSLYTICFYARPNDLCPVSLGGTRFNIFTHSFRYFGRDLIDLALPML